MVDGWMDGWMEVDDHDAEVGQRRKRTNEGYQEETRSSKKRARKGASAFVFAQSKKKENESAHKSLTTSSTSTAHKQVIEHQSQIAHIQNGIDINNAQVKQQDARCREHCILYCIARSTSSRRRQRSTNENINNTSKSNSNHKLKDVTRKRKRTRAQSTFKEQQTTRNINHVDEKRRHIQLPAGILAGAPP
mmetsp:Transcript_3142/g.8871  ORF Transcript_3142/g.8871 Transcript_3142/m.8871 type:complete len:191 (-) Transcript_3142:1398-1970(-)